MRPYRYLLLLMILISACENKRSDAAKADKVDPLKEAFWTKDFKFLEYKVESANNGFGKKLFIDSLNYKIYRGYFPGDSTKLIHEHQEDSLNDTAFIKSII